MTHVVKGQKASRTPPNEIRRVNGDRASDLTKLTGYSISSAAGSPLKERKSVSKMTYSIDSSDAGKSGRTHNLLNDNHALNPLKSTCACIRDFCYAIAHRIHIKGTKNRLWIIISSPCIQVSKPKLHQPTTSQYSSPLKYGSQSPWQYHFNLHADRCSNTQGAENPI